MWIDIRSHDGGAKSIPIRRREPLKLRNNLKAIQSIAVCTAMDGLDLEKWIFFIELDGDIGPRQTNVRKQRSEPSVSFDNAFIMFVSIPGPFVR
jgi:hypothetical protein